MGNPLLFQKLPERGEAPWERFYCPPPEANRFRRATSGAFQEPRGAAPNAWHCHAFRAACVWPAMMTGHTGDCSDQPAKHAKDAKWRIHAPLFGSLLSSKLFVLCISDRHNMLGTDVTGNDEEHRDDERYDDERQGSKIASGEVEAEAADRDAERADESIALFGGVDIGCNHERDVLSTHCNQAEKQLGSFPDGMSKPARPESAHISPESQLSVLHSVQVDDSVSIEPALQPRNLTAGNGLMRADAQPMLSENPMGTTELRPKT